MKQRNSEITVMFFAKKEHDTDISYTKTYTFKYDHEKNFNRFISVHWHNLERLGYTKIHIGFTGFILYE